MKKGKKVQKNQKLDLQPIIEKPDKQDNSFYQYNTQSVQIMPPIQKPFKASHQFSSQKKQKELQNKKKQNKKQKVQKRSKSPTEKSVSSKRSSIQRMPIQKMVVQKQQKSKKQQPKRNQSSQKSKIGNDEKPQIKGQIQKKNQQKRDKKQQRKKQQRKFKIPSIYIKDIDIMNQEMQKSKKNVLKTMQQDGCTPQQIKQIGDSIDRSCLQSFQQFLNMIQYSDHYNDNKRVMIQIQLNQTSQSQQKQQIQQLKTHLKNAFTRKQQTQLPHMKISFNPQREPNNKILIKSKKQLLTKNQYFKNIPQENINKEESSAREIQKSTQDLEDNMMEVQKRYAFLMDELSQGFDAIKDNKFIYLET